MKEISNEFYIIMGLASLLLGTLLIVLKITDGQQIVSIPGITFYILGFISVCFTRTKEKSK